MLLKMHEISAESAKALADAGFEGATFFTTEEVDLTNSHLADTDVTSVDDLISQYEALLREQESVEKTLQGKLESALRQQKLTQQEMEQTKTQLASLESEFEDYKLSSDRVKTDLNTKLKQFEKSPKWNWVNVMKWLLKRFKGLQNEQPKIKEVLSSTCKYKRLLIALYSTNSNYENRTHEFRAEVPTDKLQ